MGYSNFADLAIHNRKTLVHNGYEIDLTVFHYHNFHFTHDKILYFDNSNNLIDQNYEVRQDSIDFTGSRKIYESIDNQNRNISASVILDYNSEFLKDDLMVLTYPTSTLNASTTVFLNLTSETVLLESKGETWSERGYSEEELFRKGTNFGNRVITKKTTAGFDALIFDEAAE